MHREAVTRRHRQTRVRRRDIPTGRRAHDLTMAIQVAGFPIVAKAIGSTAPAAGNTTGMGEIERDMPAGAAGMAAVTDTDMVDSDAHTSR